MRSPTEKTLRCLDSNSGHIDSKGQLALKIKFPFNNINNFTHHPTSYKLWLLASKRTSEL